MYSWTDTDPQSAIDQLEEIVTALPGTPPRSTNSSVDAPMLFKAVDAPLGHHRSLTDREPCGTVSIGTGG
jgi:hypothetical protein